MRAAFFSCTEVSTATRPHDKPDLYLASVALAGCADKPDARPLPCGSAASVRGLDLEDLTAREVAAFVVSQSRRQTAFAAGKASLQVGRAGRPGGTPC
jgi:hypothetical protein